MSGFLWKATARNVNRALKEVNAFEWEGDYRPETAKRHHERDISDRYRFLFFDGVVLK